MLIRHGTGFMDKLKSMSLELMRFNVVPRTTESLKDCVHTFLPARGGFFHETSGVIPLAGRVLNPRDLRPKINFREL